MVEFVSTNVRRTEANVAKRSKNLNLSVRDTWAHFLIENEARAERGERPWTDAEIAAQMRAEFPERQGQKSWDRVGSYRNQYNESAYAFDGMPKPGTVLGRPVSRQYDAKGNVVAASASSRAGVDEERVRAIVRQELADRPVVKISVNGHKPVKVDGQLAHVAFEDVMTRVAAGVPVMLVGPAGSGKTHLAAQVAKALGRPFSFNSMSEGVTESSLLGRMLPQADGTWEYQPSPFVKAFQEGGVHLLDEIDAADPNLLVQVNSAVANRRLSVPFASTEPIEAHPDFVLIAAANTWGNGADRRYVGRNQLDAATVNRFTMGTVAIEYDRLLERRLVLGLLDDQDAAERLLAWAWKVREAIDASRLNRIMSTRNLQDAARLLRQGMGLGQVRDVFVQGWTADERAKVALA